MVYTREELMNFSYEELCNKLADIDLQTCSEQEMKNALLITDIICLEEKKYDNAQGKSILKFLKLA